MNKLNQSLRILLFVFLLCNLFSKSFAETVSIDSVSPPVGATDFQPTTVIPIEPVRATETTTSTSLTQPGTLQTAPGAINTFQGTTTSLPTYTVPQTNTFNIPQQPQVKTFSQPDVVSPIGTTNNISQPDAAPEANTTAGTAVTIPTTTTSDTLIPETTTEITTETQDATTEATEVITTPTDSTTVRETTDIATPEATTPEATTPDTTFEATETPQGDLDSTSVTTPTTSPQKGDLSVNASSIAQIAIIHAGCNANTCSSCNTTNIFPLNVGGSPLGACCRQNPSNPGCI